jgi:uncharacterized protein YbaA (DUF1428 family)
MRTRAIECRRRPGKHTSFPQSVAETRRDGGARTSCTSRAQRDRINAKVMKDPRLSSMMDPKAMPFDGKRMFQDLVDA